MQYFTLQDVIDAVDAELDIEGQEDVADSLVTREEKVDFINRAIRVAESEVHKLGLEDDYFRASQPLQLASGEDHYSLPTNIYANKILKIVYHNGTVIYEIKRLRRLAGRSIYEQIAYINQYGSAMNYQYYLKNDSIDFRNELVLCPASREDAPTAVDSAQIATIWYVRKANVVTQPDDMIDIPEGIDYIKQFYKCRVLSKQFRGVVPEGEIQDLESLRADMVSTLREMVPDENNLIEQDVSFYQDFDCYPNTGDY